MDAARQWLLLGFMAVLMFATGAGMLLLSRLLGPRRPRASKQDPYECGVEPIGSPRERFSVVYYLVAIFFILFDIETVFLIPWAVTYRDFVDPWVAFVLAAVFVVVLGFALIYIWARGALEWEPEAGPKKAS